MIEIIDRIKDIQRRLQETPYDGWLLYDFHRINPMVRKILRIPEEEKISRRFFYWIPKRGDPIRCIHQVEPGVAKHLPGKILFYQSYDSLKAVLRELLTGSRRVMLEYSPEGRIPQLSFVDAGTAEMICSCGVDIGSSGDILQYYTSLITEEQAETHREAARIIDELFVKTCSYMSDLLRRGKEVTEYAVSRRMIDFLRAEGMIWEGEPIVAFGKNGADPHYSPQKNASSRLQKGDVFYLDCWGKREKKGSIYADKTVSGICGETATPKQKKVFDTLRKARENGLLCIKNAFRDKKPITGAEVDREVRRTIEEEGFGPYFAHRTGHNIGEELHGFGTHLDSSETIDTRFLLPSTCFSIEPGIYIPGEFGMRSEYDVCISPQGEVSVSGTIQDHLIYLY